MASAVKTTPVNPRSRIICCAAGISLDLSSISVCARTMAEADPKAVNVWAAFERDNRLFAHLTLRQQGFRMASERVFKGLGVQRLEHGAQGVHHRRPLQVDPEVVIEVLPTVLQEGDDAAVRPGPAQQGQHREHQQIRQRIPLALRPPRVGNILQSCQKIGKRNHGTLHQGARH
jgi:hypothetical protein